MFLAISRWRPKHLLISWVAWWVALIVFMLGKVIVPLQRATHAAPGQGSIAAGFGDDKLYLRVTGRNKVLLGSGIAYFMSPIDLVPEAFLGPIGFADDLVLAVYILNKILTDTSIDIVREHWSGSEDVLITIQNVLNAADQMVGSNLLNKIKSFVK